MTAKQDHAIQLQVKLEFGHNASCRKKPTPEGFTHDWAVFVRGPDNKDISHFVDKVVFHLHESFPKPKRVFKDPPYRIEEHGYGSFNLPIDVYFKNKEEPKKVRINYDLFLPAMGLPAIDNIRSEALKFINPPEEFKRKVLKSGGAIVDSTNCINGSPVLATNTNINGNTNGNHHLLNGKEMRKDTKEEKPITTSETEKMKKAKIDKVISGKPAAKMQNISNKRPSNSSEEELHIVKKKKKKPDEISTVKATGFIPIEPLPAGLDDTVLDNKDVKLKIKSLPPKVSKKSDKATDKLIERIKEKKKDKHSDTLAADNSISKNSTKRRNSSSSKTKGKTSKSPPAPNSKAAKLEDKKLEKITFRRESGDSWSSSRSNSPGLYTSVLSSKIGSKNNALGTLMAELSDQDEDDDDDDDIDLSTPFQADSLKQNPDSVTVVNNNVLNKKDNSKPVKDKSKTKSKEALSKKSDIKNTHSLSSKKDVMKSPVKTSKTEPVKTAPSKNSPKAKLKESKNGHQIPQMDLVQLHKQLSSIKDGNCLQKVADILEHSGCFIITETTLDFDLCKLDSATIKQIQQCIER